MLTVSNIDDGEWWFEEGGRKWWTLWPLPRSFIGFPSDLECNPVSLSWPLRPYISLLLATPDLTFYKSLYFSASLTLVPLLFLKLTKFFPVCESLRLLLLLLYFSTPGYWYGLLSHLYWDCCSNFLYLGLSWSSVLPKINTPVTLNHVTLFLCHNV